MTLPAPDYQEPYRCDHCGYVGDTGPTHYHPRAAVGHLCPMAATGGQRYYSEAVVREVVSQRIGGIARKI